MTKSIRRLGRLALVLLLAAGAACKKQPAADQTTTLTIGISIPGMDHGWTGGVVWWAEQAKKKWEAEDQNIRIILSTAKDSSEQVDKIENLLVQGINALVVLPHEPGPLTRVCELAARQGVYLVVVDRGLDKPVHNVFVAGDNPGFGRACGEALAKQLDGKGKIVIMEGIPCPVNGDRVNAFMEVIRKHPGIDVLDSQAAYWDPEKGLRLMENFLQKYPAIDAVWTGDDDVLLGALKAYAESGRRDIKYFIGGAGSKAVVKMILDRNPAIPFNVTYPPAMIATAVDFAVKGLRQEIPDEQKTHIVPAEIITPENAQEFYFPDSVY